MKYREKPRTVVASLRMPEDVYEQLMRRAVEEDSDFSKLVRRAVRRELTNSGFARPEKVPAR